MLPPCNLTLPIQADIPLAQHSSPFESSFFLINMLCFSLHQKCHLLHLLFLLKHLFSRKLFLSLLAHMVLLLSGSPFRISLFSLLLASLPLCLSICPTCPCILRHIGSFSTKLCLFIVHFCTIHISKNLSKQPEFKEKK